MVVPCQAAVLSDDCADYVLGVIPACTVNSIKKSKEHEHMQFLIIYKCFYAKLI